jgi:hypothetical protein
MGPGSWARPASVSHPAPKWFLYLTSLKVAMESVANISTGIGPDCRVMSVPTRLWWETSDDGLSCGAGMD